MAIIIMSEEERYSNRQFERMLDDQNKVLKEHMSLLITPLTTQVTKTNGTVKWQTKMLYMALGALILLVPWAGWVTTQILTVRQYVTVDELNTSVENALRDNLQPQ